MGAAHAERVAPIPVNPKLVQFQQRYGTPRLVEVSPGIFAAMAYDYSNYVFIEGRTGIIVVDTGWFQAPFERAFADLRKHSDKPVVAIIYTHAHDDHTGGGRYAASQARGAIPIYAPSGFDNFGRVTEGPAQAIIRKRGYQQMGLGLPAIGIPLIGSGVGPAVTPSGRAVAPPTDLIDETRTVEIDGVRIEMIRTGVDLPEALMIWLPDRKLLIPGDIIGGVFPFVKTPRYEPQREPADTVRAIDMALSLRPEVVVPGHGRELVTRGDIDDVLQANRDAVQFLIDQVDRGMVHGLSAEEIVHRVTLPKSLAEHPDLQPFYHRREWVVRAMVSDRLGFFDSYMQLFRHDGVEEAKRLVALAGGPEKMLEAAGAALRSDDPRWSLRLADLLHLSGSGNPRSEAIYTDALQKLAEITDNMNERHYALSLKAERDGRIDWSRALAPRARQAASQLPSLTLLRELGARLKAEESEGQTFDFGIEVMGDRTQYRIGLRHAVLQVGTASTPASDRLVLPRVALDQLRSQEIGWSELLARPDVQIVGNRAPIERFMKVME